MKRIIQIALLLLLISGTAFGQAKETNNKPILYLYADKLPTFEYDGGVKKYIYSNLKWPYQADVEGHVLVSFVIKKDGNVGNIKIEKGLMSKCDEEVIRVIENMPKWTPGELNSEKVDIKLYLRVTFVMNGKYEEWE